MKKYFVIATHWDEERKAQVKYIAGAFNDFPNANIFKNAYNEHYKADAVICVTCKILLTQVTE